MRSTSRNKTGSSLKSPFTSEVLFHRAISDMSLAEQTSLLLTYYCGLTDIQVLSLTKDSFVMTTHPPYFLMGGKAYFLKGPLLDIVRKWIETDTKLGSKNRELYLKALTTWRFAIHQTYEDYV